MCNILLSNSWLKRGDKRIMDEAAVIGSVLRGSAPPKVGRQD